MSYLTDDVRSVLSAANTLDYDLSELYTSICEENKLNHLSNHALDRYQVRSSEIEYHLFTGFLLSSDCATCETSFADRNILVTDYI